MEKSFENNIQYFDKKIDKLPQSNLKKKSCILRVCLSIIYSKSLISNHIRQEYVSVPTVIFFLLFI